MAELKLKSRTGIVQNSAKLLLKNVIRHTDTHNRLVEEAQMWQLYNKMKGRTTHDRDSELAGRRSRKRKDECDGDRRQHIYHEPDVKNSFLYDDRQMVKGVSSIGRHSRCRAHMDCDDDSRMQTSGPSAGGSSTYWMRQLDKAEAADGERWGHAGYKELYPQDFQSDRSGSSEKDSDSDGSSSRDERRKKRKKLKSDVREQKRLKREKKRKKRLKKMSAGDREIYEKKKKSKRKRRREDEDSDSDNRQTKRSKKDRSGSNRRKKRK